MATSPQLYHEQVAEFAEDWHAFRGLLTPDEQERWDDHVDAAKAHPYPGQVQHAVNAEWSIVCSILVEQ